MIHIIKFLSIVFFLNYKQLNVVNLLVTYLFISVNSKKLLVYSSVKKSSMVLSLQYAVYLAGLQYHLNFNFCRPPSLSKLTPMIFNTGLIQLGASRRGTSDSVTDSFQIPLTPRMFPVWDFLVGIFARKVLLNMGRVLSTLS